MILHSKSPSMLQDSDTVGILKGINERNNALSWFATDWPLQNHFYRPISTLFFEFDNAVWPRWAAGFGLTNAFLVALCIGLVALISHEIFQTSFVKFFAPALFAFWCLGQLPEGSMLILGLLGLTAWAFVAIRNNLKVWDSLIFAGGINFFISEFAGISRLRTPTMDWLPGRTASSMSVFALCFTWIWLRYLKSDCKKDWPLIFALLCLALGSYEQAVMLPAIALVLTAFLAKNDSLKSVKWTSVKHFKWAIFGTGFCLLAYMVVRLAFLPTNVSRYQNQQLRFGSGVWFSNLEFIWPGGYSFFNLFTFSQLGAGFDLVFLPNLWHSLAFGILWIFSVIWVFRQKDRNIGFAFWICSVLAFLPMSFLKHFDHYYFFPMTMRAILVAYLAKTILEPIIVAARLTTRAGITPSSPSPE